MTSRRNAARPLRATDSRGITAVFFAICVTGLLAVAALVLGGSIGYTAVRNAQTAADSAALAGTSTLRDHKQDWVRTPAEEVLEAVRSVVEDNGAELEPGGCELVRAGYALGNDESDVVGDCTRLAVLSEDEFVAVAGVRVTVSDTRDVPFSAFVDQETITGAASASATIQPVREGRAPYMVCSTTDGHPAAVLIENPSDPTGYSINPGAIGLDEDFVLHGNAMKVGNRQCGAGSKSWRGFVAFNGSYPLPSPDPVDDTHWWQVKTGNANGHLTSVLAGADACSGDVGSVEDCVLALPLCTKSNGEGGFNLRLHCVKMGAFEITWNQHSTGSSPPCNDGKKATGLVCGRFIGAATVATGQGGAQTPDPHGIALIKLVE